MWDAFVEFKRLIEVPRRFLRIGQSVAGVAENIGRRWYSVLTWEWLLCKSSHSRRFRCVIVKV